MGEYLDQIPGDIQHHIKEITKTSGLDDSEESIELVAQAWLEKKECFEEKIQDQNMEDVDSFEKEDERGALVLTYSGSLVNVGPIVNGARKAEYTSLGIRTDVPDSASSDNAKLGGEVKINEGMEFEVGPVKSTSSVHKIAVCKEEMSAEEQEETLKNTTIVLSDEFVKINKTIMTEESDADETEADNSEEV